MGRVVGRPARNGFVGLALALGGPGARLGAGRAHPRLNVEDEATYYINAGTFWTDITFHPGRHGEVKADGLPNAQGAALVQALNVVLREKRLREDVAFLQGVQRTIDAWLDHKAEQERACFEQRRWFTHEQQEDFLAARPTVDPAALRSRLKKPGVAVRLGPAAQAIARSLAAWEADHRPAWAALNAAHMEGELVACKELLDRVESKPLTPEQARADACFDNRVQVVASAGSGKTSMMVAKAAYALPLQILRHSKVPDHDGATSLLPFVDVAGVPPREVYVEVRGRLVGVFKVHETTLAPVGSCVAQEPRSQLRPHSLGAPHASLTPLPHAH
ncbi:UvrD-helicase domain-containing protein [Stenotrophomonas hibiscicola]|uniref:UvrD-helicase domain-containing protein n=1 Tax=Stenotrophomonas hibiscicola TaxID=86189 RepID=UPI0032092C75